MGRIQRAAGSLVHANSSLARERPDRSASTASRPAKTSWRYPLCQDDIGTPIASKVSLGRTGTWLYIAVGVSHDHGDRTQGDSGDSQ